MVKMKNLFRKICAFSLTSIVMGQLIQIPLQVSAEEIKVWAWDPKFNIHALEVAKKYFEQEHSNITVVIEENAQNDIIQKLNTSMSVGALDTLPNVVLIEDYRAQSFLAAYPNYFVPLNDYFQSEDFAQYKIETTSIEDKHYAIPFDTGVTGLYIRIDVFEEAGYTIDDLTNITWNELIDIGQKVNEVTGVKLLSMDLNDLGLVRAMINSSNVWYTKEDGVTPYIEENEALAEAFVTLKTMIERDLLNIHNDWAQMLEAINTGKVFTVPQGNWITPSVVQAEDQFGKWKVVPWPRQDIAGSVNASNLGGSSFYVINKEGADIAAQYLASTFGSSSEFYAELISEIGALGTYLPVQETEAYDIEVGFFANQPIYREFAHWANEIPAINYGSHTYAVEDIMVSAFQEYLQGVDLEIVMQNAQQQANNALN